jgi:SAM-dependent methyltransferase
MPATPIVIDRAEFGRRQDRAAYLVAHYGHLLRGKVLDVGCDQGYLKGLLDGAHYTGIDKEGGDLPLDLERAERLPFPEAHFDAVVCTDVLEHLDNLYRMFGELARVSGRWLVVSLPNCWCGARLKLQRGRGHIGHYGLPREAPADRHKWFFSLTEAREFLESRPLDHAVALRELRCTEKPRPSLVTLARRVRYPGRDAYLNRYAHTVWGLFERAG